MHSYFAVLPSSYQVIVDVKKSKDLKINKTKLKYIAFKFVL